MCDIASATVAWEQKTVAFRYVIYVSSLKIFFYSLEAVYFDFVKDRKIYSAFKEKGCLEKIWDKQFEKWRSEWRPQKGNN